MLFTILVIASACAPVNADEQALRAKIQSKMMLAQSYLESRVADEITSSEATVPVALLKRARELAEEANSDMREGLLVSAQVKVDQSIQLFNLAAANNARRKQSHQQSLIEIESVRAEIDAYLESYRAALAEKARADDGILDQDRVARLISSAEQSKDKGDIQSTRTTLDEARQLVVAALVAIRDKETVVYTVEFETPADEFRYEEERYREYVTLGQKVLANGEIDQPRKQLFLQLSDAGNELSREAVAWAEEGDYDSAINRMQVAISKMIEGLRLLGIPLSM